MSLLSLKGKTAVVTGGSRGIGKAIVEELLGQGALVLVAGNEAEPAWCNNYKKYQYQLVDFLDSQSIDQFLTEIEHFGKIDILVNSAGIHIPKSLFKLTDGDFEKVLKVNLLGPMMVLRKVAEKMRQARSGKIVNISSIAGIVSKPTSSAYSASKSGLIGLTRASSLELAPHNVLINALCPGTTQTDMIKTLLSVEQTEEIKAAIPLKRLARVEEIAAFALFLCSDMNTYITGQTIVVDGGTIIK